MEQEIDLKIYLRLFRTNWKLFVIIPIIAVITSGILSFYVMEPAYQATASLLIQEKNKDKVDYEYNTLLANKEMLKTYSKIAQSRRVLENIKTHVNSDLPYEDFITKIKVNTLGDSQLLYYEVEDKSPEQAAKIANAASLVFIDEIEQITGFQNVKLVDRAIVPDKPVKPRKLLNVAIAGLLGVMAASGIILVKDYFDNSVKGPQEAEELFNLPVLATIPNVKDQKSIIPEKSLERRLSANEFTC